MKIYITGVGWVNIRSMGSGRNSASFTPHRDTLPPIERRKLFDHGFKHFGRLDAFSRVGLAGITFALTDAGLVDWQTKRNIGMAVVSELGCLGTDVEYHHTVIDVGSPSPSPALFSYTLPNSFLGEAAVYFGLTGPSYTLTDPSPANLFGVLTAMDLILNGQVQGMLAGQCDVTAPSELPLSTAMDPGCTILMMEKEDRLEGRAYGQLEKTVNNTLVFNDQPVSHLNALVHRCVEAIVESH